MTILFMDGFDSYNDQYSMVTGNRWDNIGLSDTFSDWTWSASQGVRGGGVMLLNDTQERIYKYLGVVSNTLVTGFWFKHNTTHSTVRHFMLWQRDNAGAAQATLGFNASQQFVLYRGNLTTLIATGATVIQQNRWYYIEIKINFADAGSYSLKIDNVVEFSGSTDMQALGSSGADWFEMFHTTANSGTYWIDDIYVLNTDGSAPQNDFLGPHYIYTLKPSGDNTVVGTPSSGGTSFDDVDETTTNLDTDYVTHTSAGTDLFDMGNLSVTPSQISAVQTEVVTKKTNSGTCTARSKLKSNATTSNGTTQAMGPEYQWWTDIFELDPDGSIAWTASSVNSAIVGVERVS
jgi:hypothetical protein